MPLSTNLLAFAALLAGLSGAARADVRDTVNWVRTRGCPGAVAGPLHDSRPLTRVAQLMSNGIPLGAALATAGYRAAESSAMHLSNAGNDGQVGRLLAARDCTALTDPRLADLGVLRRGSEVWIVLASEVQLPSPRDADLIRGQILALVNQARRNGRRCGSKSYPATAPLVLNEVLTDAALAHSREMATLDEFDHRGHDGSTPAARVARAGYGRYRVIGENIAAGVMTPAEVTQGWLDSPPHCENIMDPRFREIGIAFAVNPASSEVVYWTQDFAAPGHQAE
jgi:uncharacterized protein YkwD